MSGSIRDYRDLIVWQKSIELVVRIYQITKSLPDDEKFGLISQMRRAAVSISSNIAEGNGRVSRNDYVRFLNYAVGSCNELDTQVEISRRLEYTQDNVCQEISDNLIEIKKMLISITKKLNQSG